MKRRSSVSILLALLVLSLATFGCATTSSQTAKPHEPQMITGEEEREGMKLPDSIANILSFLGQFAPK